MAEEKLFEPDTDGPECRLTVESYPDNPYTYLYYSQGNPEGLATAGVATLHPAIVTDARGAFASGGPVTDWSRTHYHANGDRTRVDHRLTASIEDAAVVVRHEQRREQVLGRGRSEHDWQLQEGWRITTDGVTTLEGGDQA